MLILEKQLYFAHFRDLYHKVLYISLPSPEALAGSIDVLPEATGVLAYGVVEEGAGLTFVVLATAIYKSKGDGSEAILQIGPDVSDKFCRFRYEDARTLVYVPQEALPFNAGDHFRDPGRDLGIIREALETGDPLRAAMLNVRSVDKNRVMQYPEYVAVTLKKTGLRPEHVYARPLREDHDGSVYGSIVGVPRQDFGITPEDLIKIDIYEDGEGGTVLMWDGDSVDTNVQ